MGVISNVFLSKINVYVTYFQINFSDCRTEVTVVKWKWNISEEVINGVKLRSWKKPRNTKWGNLKWKITITSITELVLRSNFFKSVCFRFKNLFDSFNWTGSVFSSHFSDVLTWVGLPFDNIEMTWAIFCRFGFLSANDRI